MVCTPSVNRRNAVGISTVIFISILVSCDRNHAVVDERFKLRQSRSNRRSQRVFLRNGVNRLQAVAGDADHGCLAGIDISLLEQFLGDAGGHASGRLGENSFGFGEQLNALDDFRIGDIFRPAAAVANRARGVIAVRRISDGERPRNRLRFLRLKLFELALDGVRNRGAPGRLRAEEFHFLFLEPAPARSVR